MTTRWAFGSEAADLSAFRVPWTAGLIKSLCGSVTLKWNGDACVGFTGGISEESWWQGRRSRLLTVCRNASTPLIASSNAPAYAPPFLRQHAVYALEKTGRREKGRTHGLDILDDDKLELVLAVPLLLEQIGEVLPLVLTPDGTTNTEPMLEELLGAVYSTAWISAFIPVRFDRPRVERRICMTTGSVQSAELWM